MAGVVYVALHTLAQVRYMHWMTTDYIAHKQLGELYETLDGLVDRFVESYLGTHSSDKVSRVALQQESQTYSQILINIKAYYKDLRKSMDDTALENIIDEITGAIDQTLYILRMQ